MTTISMPAAAEQLVRRYYVYGGIYTLAASIIWGVNALFLLDAGLTVTEVFIANAAWSFGTMVFEIPTGVVADTLGRRISLLLSVAVLAVTTLAYVGLAQVGAGLIGYVIVSVLIGLGFTFYSGAMEAWLVDGVRFHGYDGKLDRIFSRGQVVSGGAMLVGTVGGGLLGQIDLAIPFLVRSALLIALFVLAYIGMRDLGFNKKEMTWREVPAEAGRIGRAGITFGWNHGSLRLIMLATSLQDGMFAWAWYAWQPYFLELLGEDAVWVAGVVAALLAGAMMTGNALVDVVTRWCGRRTTLFLWSAAGFSLAMVGVGVVTSFIPALLLLLVALIAVGLQKPVRMAFLHDIVPSEQRATVASLDSLIGGAGMVVGQAGLGAFSDRRGFSAGYILGGLVTLGAIPLLVLVRRKGDNADFFVGENPEFCTATPAAPSVAGVDVSPREEKV